MELDEWIGTNVDGSEGQDPCPNGPIITIRHPEWTEDKLARYPHYGVHADQWAELSEGRFSVGAALQGLQVRAKRRLRVCPTRPHNYAF